MSGSISRSISMANTADVMRAGNGGGDGRRMPDSPTTSPLKIFVLAKKRINDIFEDIAKYIYLCANFLEEIKHETNITDNEQVELVRNFTTKIAGISEVLARDHMKVAFFGRTSNGKSSVINAMLRKKILPSGIGHTTNCFLQVEGSNSSEAYLLTEDSTEPKNVQSVTQLANALCSEKLGENALVRIFWPKEKCALLKDDVVLVDSPGIDVSPNLDEWIDKHCLDADVFVLVANAESTLMQTEKKFFHKVNARLSKPNIFILNNRWDASASEPDIMDEVRKQHLDRNMNFLVDELKVVTKQQAEDRVFFVSAKEALQARLKQQDGLPPQNGALAEGFQARMFEFQDFERKFEECISKSALKTKFEQHTQRGKNVTSDLRTIMEQIYDKARDEKLNRMTLQKEQKDRLDFTVQQLSLLTQEVKDKIRQMVEEVERKVSSALNEEIRRLSVIVDEFNKPFHPDNLVLNVYKRELHSYVEEGLGRNLTVRCSSALAQSLENTQKEMTERMSDLIPPEHKHQTQSILPRRDFEVLYRLDCHNLCADFQEDIEFRFSLGITTLINRFLGPKGAKLMLTSGSYIEPIPRVIPCTPQTPSSELYSPIKQDEMVTLITGLASLTSRTTMGVMIVTGVVWRAVGWRIIALSAGLYGLLYLYERLTWTNKARERTFKKQYVGYATRKLKLIVDLTSSNCSHQVQQELSSTFARLCHLVDNAESELKDDIEQLNKQIVKLEEIVGQSKVLKNKASFLDSELNTFVQQYLQHTD